MVDESMCKACLDLWTTSNGHADGAPRTYDATPCTACRRAEVYSTSAFILVVTAIRGCRCQSLRALHTTVVPVCRRQLPFPIIRSTGLCNRESKAFFEKSLRFTVGQQSRLTKPFSRCSIKLSNGPAGALSRRSQTSGSKNASNMPWPPCRCRSRLTRH